jgi:hypothetical protein
MSKLILSAMLAIAFNAQLSAQTDTSSITWYFDRTDSIGGYKVSPLSQLPTIIETPQGKAALFDGVSQGMLLYCNPIRNIKSYTTRFVAEIYFRFMASCSNCLR